jgi:hypothetical protein
MVTLSGWFGFNTYKSYMAYASSQKNTKGSITVEAIDEFLNHLQNEEYNSAIYFGSNGEQNFDKLKKVRADVDNAFNALVSKFTQNKFNSNLQGLSNIKEDLKFARTTVDALNGSFKDIVYDVYYNKIFLTLLKEANKIAKADTSDTMKNYLDSYVKYMIPK